MCIVRHLTILYDSECWVLKEHERKIKVAKMKMLRWMCGHIRKRRIPNDVIR